MKAPAFNFKPAKSSNVEATAYDQASQTLAVRFKGGKIYHYANVPQEIHTGLGKAESIGKYIGAHVVGKFTHTLQKD